MSSGVAVRVAVCFTVRVAVRLDVALPVTQQKGRSALSVYSIREEALDQELQLTQTLGLVFIPLNNAKQVYCTRISHDACLNFMID